MHSSKIENRIDFWSKAIVVSWELNTEPCDVERLRRDYQTHTLLRSNAEIHRATSHLQSQKPRTWCSPHQTALRIIVFAITILEFADSICAIVWVCLRLELDLVMAKASWQCLPKVS